ncbi:amidase family protein [Vallitalea sp.]|jgi:amidase|uniref:amidase family protein n=1 Tax=Vallitalea sp. TaxID=1882829 RepID=UPI0025D9C92C|nr:amidase family protein [Vallitalea sp.]MCT4687566.1 amidase family protein [Vallitalea sp.]
MKSLRTILTVVFSFAVVAAVILYTQIKKIASSNNQSKKQVDKQEKDIKTTAKRPLDFSAFESDLNKLGDQRYKEIEKSLIESDIKSIQKSIESGNLTYEELVLFYIKRIKEIDNNRLNTVLQLNPDAVVVAREMDEKKNNGEKLSDLHGIPVLLKDNIGTGDKLTNTAGAKVLEDSSCDRDAYIVKKLREAGAIILGKTNLSEWANFMSIDSSNGYSALGGQTHNPYGNYDVGGSSSGSGAGVSANFAPLAIGTETAGSIISPSSQNSVVGIKPTVGLWSRDRIIPLAIDLDTAGPIARTVEDAAMLLGELVGEDENDIVTSDVPEKEDYTTYLDKNGLQGMSIGIVTNKEVTSSYRNDDSDIINKIKEELINLGADVKNVELDDKAFRIDEHVDMMAYEYKTGVEEYLNAIGDNAPVKTIKEITGFNKRDLDSRAYYGQYFIEKARDINITEDENTKILSHNRSNTGSAIDEALENDKVDVLISLNNYLSGIYPIAGYPAITVPAGYRDSGEPIGLTITSTKFSEGLLIKAAYAYEQGTKHRIQPNIK